MPSFYDTFVRAAENAPQNVALEMQRQDRVECYTCAEVRQMAESLGRWLAENGIIGGARCAILAANSPRWTASYLGMLAAGAVVVPLDTTFNPHQVAKILTDSEAGLLLVDSQLLPVAQKAMEEWPTRLLLMDGAARGIPDLDAIYLAGPGSFRPVEVAPDDPASILYTSGTTSDPKGVMLTHENIFAEADGVFRVIDVGPSDSVLSVLPLFHALGLMGNLLLPLAAGARITYLEAVNVTELVRGLRERGTTVFACVPQFFYLIHERIMKQVAEKGALAGMGFRLLLTLSRTLRRLGWKPAGKRLFPQIHRAIAPDLRFFVTGGSRFDAAVGRDLQDMGFEVLQAYGLTETAGAATLTPPNENIMGSIGRPLPGVGVKILPATQAEGGSGEIAICGPIVMKGYYKRPDATAEVLRDGWLRTGDLGNVDASGNVFITGREKDVIVLSSGKNVYPEEIEEHYAKSQWIKEICVVGVESRPGEPASERLHAVIVPNFELLKQKKIVNTKEVIRFDLDTLSAQLPSTKRILSYEISLDDLPRTTTRKLKRFQVQQRVQAEMAAGEAPEIEARQPRTLSDDDAAWMDDPQVARALDVVRRTSKKSAEIYPNDNLELDLGLDSMERVELLVALERELNAHVPDTVISEVYTVRELVDAVHAAVGSGAPVPARYFSGWDKVFQTESADPEVLEIVSKKRRIVPLLWFLWGRFVALVARDLMDLRTHGLEKIPQDGPFIISPNHQSFLDAPVLMSQLPWRLYKKVFYVGTSEIFGKGLMRRIAYSLRLVPVDPDANLVPAMRAGAYGLKRGQILVLYPEGERSIDGTPKTFKKGAAILATHLNVPIVPVALEGFHDIWPRGKFIQRLAKLRIAIGDPITPPAKVDAPERTYEQLTAELKRRVVDMWRSLRRELGKPIHPDPQSSPAGN